MLIDVPAAGWAAFLALVSALLLVDLLVVHRRPHAPSMRRAAIESAVWITIGLSFSLVILAAGGTAAMGEYVSAYLIEKSLSVDNVFVWALILTHFAVPRQYQHRVLFWGVFGALALRAVFIFAGLALLERLTWVIYLFGGFLVFTAIRLLLDDETEVDPDRSAVLRAFRRLVPSTDRFDGQKLFTMEGARRVATPLFFVLVVIEVTDLIFAVDSIPAVLAVSQDRFIVFSSNAFAILGLRALYFLFADLQGRFRYLTTGLSAILAFVGIKMILGAGIPGTDLQWHAPTWLALSVIVGVLTVAIVASIVADRREGRISGRRIGPG